MKLLILFALPFLAVSAPKEVTVETVVQSVLPSPLPSVKAGVTTRPEAEKLLGKPLSGSDKTKYFYRLPNSGDLTIGFDKGGKARYYYYQIPASEKPVALSTFKNLLPPETVKKAVVEMKKESAKPGAGSAFNIALPAKGLQLKFKNAEEPVLKAVLVWQAGEKMP